MKKILGIITIIISVLAINVKAEIDLPEKTDREPVKIYLFYADYCSHCHEFIEEFLDLEEEYKDYFEIVAYMAGTQNKNTPESVKTNYELATKIKDYFEVPDNQFGFPVIVIGDYQTCGYGNGLSETLINEALKQYQKEDYKDVVETLRKDNNINATKETLFEAAVASGLRKKPGSIPDGVIVAIIFVVLAGGLGTLIYLSRK